MNRDLAFRDDTSVAAAEEPVVRSVLVVDDSRVQRRIMAAYLGKLGYRVIEAGSGEEAMALSQSADFDMIISDWMMTGMNGLDFCRAFRAQDRERYVYFILLTSKSEKTEVARGLDVGADDFLAKPVGLDELRARIAAGERILRMERDLARQNRLANKALAELQLLYDSIDRDLVEARKLQQTLVRERRRSFAEGEVNLLLQPCGHVGGDLVAFFRVGDDGLGLLNVDVSGHGIASALLTARLAAYLTGNSPSRNLALSFDANGRIVGNPPEQVAARLNRLMLEEVETSHYFTMVLAMVNLRTGLVQLVQAGHPAPLVQGADGTVRSVGAGGMPIGLLAEAEYERVTLTLAPGERLILASDGFVECPDPQGRLLGDDGLMDMVRNRHELRGSALLEALVWDLNAHSDDRDFPDDISAVLFEFTGPE